MADLKIDCTLHGLRHTHVSQLIAAGLDVLTISRRMGHASAAITLRVYGHLFRNTDARAAKIMEARFLQGAHRLRTNSRYFRWQSGGNLRTGVQETQLSRVSSVVEQRFCKPLVGSSNLSPGTIGSRQHEAAYFGIRSEDNRTIKRPRSQTSTSRPSMVCCTFWMAS